MKTIQVISIMAAILGSVTAIATPETGTNGVQIVAVGSGDNMFFGEPATVGPDPMCTKCVGNHGLCTIGDGSCYAPDGCYFCGGCGAKRARCQNPKTEKCQCY